MTDTPVPDFRHILHMTDRHGTFEQADLADPRQEQGYCTDDMARLLVVTTREPEPTPDVSHLAGTSLQFLGKAGDLDGAFRRRMKRNGQWEDDPAIGDTWGRSIWSLGTAAVRSDANFVRQVAIVQFTRAAKRRSPDLRPMALAALGAAEVLGVHPDHHEARLLLNDAANEMPDPRSDAAWPWPEDRLGDANAVVPEAMIAAGDRLDRPDLVQRGLDLLAWLLDHETRDGHLSVTPSGGDGHGAPRPAFDQHPTEVAALADACARAAVIDGAGQWSAGVESAVAWFLGDNDVGAVMWDAETGGCYDRLTIDGPDRNQSTGSSLALLSTLQHARRLVTVPT